MKFEWDSEKNEINMRKHGVDFEEAKTVFEDEMAIAIYDEEHSADEDRFKATSKNPFPALHKNVIINQQ